MGDFKSKKIILAHLEKMINTGMLKGIESQFPISSDGNGAHIQSDQIKIFTSWIIGKIILDSIEKIQINMTSYMDKYSKQKIVTNWYPIIEEIATDKVGTER